MRNGPALLGEFQAILDTCPSNLPRIPQLFLSRLDCLREGRAERDAGQRNSVPCRIPLPFAGEYLFTGGRRSRNVTVACSVDDSHGVCDAMQNSDWMAQADEVRCLAMALGATFMSLGWGLFALQTLEVCLATMPPADEPGVSESVLLQHYAALTRYGKALHTCCRYVEARGAFNAALQLKLLHPFLPNPAFVYALMSELYGTKCNLLESQQFAELALVACDSDVTRVTERERIFVLRTVSRMCIGRRQFPRARGYLQEALAIAHAAYGKSHPILSGVLSDCGHYLLN
eukprot:Opistho-2@36338